MTPAESKFSDVEGELMRARCLARVLRHVTDFGFDDVDDALWGGVYIIACEAETALDTAANLWKQAHRIIDRTA